MHFERLQFQNFASYYGEHTLDLSCNQEKPVVVIIGGTGYGKTSIFDALNWALYGKEYENELGSKREKEMSDYFNEYALNEAFSKGDKVEMAATLYFEHDGAHYYITQSITAEPVQISEGALRVNIVNRSTSLYEIKQDGNHRPLEYDSIFMDEILPNNVKDYFLFDGDRIYYLSNPGASQEVRDAIYRVVDLELIKNAITHLHGIAKEYRKESKKESTDELGEIEEKYSYAQDRLLDLKTALDNWKNEELAIKAQIDKLEGKLAKLPDTSELQANRQNLIQRIQSTEQDLEEKASEIRNLCSKAALKFAEEPIGELINELESKREKGQIPKKVSQTLLKDLLNIKRCICGTEFAEGDEIHNTLMDRLIKEQKKASGQGLLELLFQLSNTIDSIKDADVSLKKLEDEHYKLTEARREFDLAVKQIDEELEKLPKGDANKIAGELKERRADLQTVTRKIQQSLYRIEECESDIKELKRQRETMGKKQEKIQKLQMRENLAQGAAKMFEDMYGAFAEDSRKSIEKLTRDEFKQFVISASEYDVALSEDYELQVIDSTGNPALQKLSMGQSQCLSLAFITAISRVSEKNPPIVIDMPFGRLDRDVHEQVSKRLPELASQLILFLIPEIEWNDVTRKNLEWKANYVYSLGFDEKNRTTEIQLAR